MNRLTIKINENRRKYRVLTIEDKVEPGTYFAEDFCIRNDEAIDKLGHYEDLDEELGIKYPVLVKLIKQQGFFAHYRNEIIWVSLIPLEQSDIGSKLPDTKMEEAYMSIYGGTFFLYNIGYLYHFNNYGKTWALTREELS